MERIGELAGAAGASWTLPRIGSPVDLRRPKAGGTWWRELD